MKTEIWAHRGASAYAPENTLIAFKLAADMKADGIELDVHPTADGPIAVCHDATIDRTSDGSGKIAEMTLAELRRFSFAGSYRDKYEKVPIPTLCEVYELIKPYQMKVNVEIKGAGIEFFKAIVKCEVECGMKGRVVYSSFNHITLAEILKLDAGAFVAPLYGDGLVTPWKYAASFGAKALHPHYGAIYMTENYIELSHREGVRVHPWTVDDEDDIKRLIALGADAIITNRPDAALRVRDTFIQ